MRYTEFRDAIRKDLSRNQAGLTWKALKERNQLPYERPCPTWTRSLEQEIGLKRLRVEGFGNSLVWVLNGERASSSR